MIEFFVPHQNLEKNIYHISYTPLFYIPKITVWKNLNTLFFCF